MGILNDNLEDEFDYKVCVINQLKDYVHKFYGRYSPTATSYEIEGYKNVDLEKLIYIVECPVEKIMGAYICISYVSRGLAIIMLENPRVLHRLTDKNGYGMDITFQKVVDVNTWPIVLEDNIISFHPNTHQLGKVMWLVSLDRSMKVPEWLQYMAKKSNFRVEIIYGLK